MSNAKGNLLQYPVRDSADWQRLDRAPLFRRITTYLRHAKLSVRPRREARLVRHSGEFTPLAADDIPVLCIVRNANNYIRSFLAYYRKLGVTRFLFVDDRSDDGTRQVLENAPDVDLYTSNLEYKDVHLGAGWRDALFDIYGRNHWYLLLDADEFLVFPQSESRSLRSFIDDLETAGIRRCFAPMLDLYPPGALAASQFVDDGKQWPFEVSSHFDSDSYRIKPERYGHAVRGGPRQRLFGRDMRLSKFPLIWVDSGTDFRRGSVHGPGPCFRNFVPVTAVLLHYRFSSHSMQEFRKIVAVGGHAGGSAHYNAILASPGFSENFSLAYKGSLKFSGSQDLIDRGFMMDLRRGSPQTQEH